MNNIQTISAALTTTIKDGEFQSITADIAETLLDSVLDEGVLKDLPGFSLLVGTIKTVNNVKDHLFLKKLISFLTQLKDIPEEQRQELIDEIDESQKYRTKVGEKLLFIIDKTDDTEKAEILGKLFKVYLSKQISYIDFLRAAACIENVFLADLKTFVDARWPSINVDELKDAESLLSSGIIRIGQIDPSLDEKKEVIENSELTFIVTNIGEIIREFLTTKPYQKRIFHSLF